MPTFFDFPLKHNEGKAEDSHMDITDLAKTTMEKYGLRICTRECILLTDLFLA